MDRRRSLLAVLAAVAVAAVVPVAAGLLTGNGAGTGPEPAPDPSAAAAATAERMSAAGIVDVPVRFQVQNRNTSLAPCTTQEGPYEVAGHLTLPADAGSAVTLYLHDFATAEWYWRLDVPGYHHSEELARRGHASLTVDRLGYGASPGPNGFHACVGAQADVADQIVSQLRSGGYAVDGLDTPPAFSTVAVAGLGTGAQIAQLTTLFGSVDGLAVMGWADMGRTDRFMTRIFGNLSTCMQQVGSDMTGTADGGYSWFDVGAGEYRVTNFQDTEPAVLAMALPRQSRHPCKELTSQMEAISADLREMRTVSVPVLGVFGEQDQLFTGGQEQLGLFTSAVSTELVSVPGAGHYLGLERSAAVEHDAMAAWLAALPAAAVSP